MDSFDTETFVKLVRARSALWDVRTEEYANKVKRKECWLEIFRIMIEDFDELHDDMKALKYKESGKVYGIVSPEN